MLECGMFIHWMRQAIGRKEGGEMRGKRKHFGWFAVMLGLLLFAAAGMKASADMGPKSELVVVVRNPPQEQIADVSDGCRMSADAGEGCF